MELTEKNKQILINEVVKIFTMLPGYTGDLHFKVSISEGNIVLNFREDIRRELIRLSKNDIRK